MSNHLDPPLLGPEPDPLATRLQARVDALEAAPDLEQASRRHHRVEPTAGPAVAAGDHQGGIDDLNAQLDHLRTQLEAAFDDVDGRMDAALRTAAEADSRAQVASARAAGILDAVEELSVALTSIAEQADRETAQRLRSVVGRLRSRLQPTTGT